MTSWSPISLHSLGSLKNLVDPWTIIPLYCRARAANLELSQATVKLHAFAPGRFSCALAQGTTALCRTLAQPHRRLSGEATLKKAATLASHAPGMPNT